MPAVLGRHALAACLLAAASLPGHSCTEPKLAPAWQGLQPAAAGGPPCHPHCCRPGPASGRRGWHSPCRRLGRETRGVPWCLGRWPRDCRCRCPSSAPSVLPPPCAAAHCVCPAVAEGGEQAGGDVGMVREAKGGKQRAGRWPQELRPHHPRCMPAMCCSAANNQP
jgi:hypothetical protein